MITEEEIIETEKEIEIEETTEEKLPPLSTKQLETFLVPIEAIRQHPKNYRVHPPNQLASLKASLRSFGWTKPICANLQGEIVSGHGMYLTALEEGYTKIPVMYVTFDEQLSKAYIVADNETARRAITDNDLLKDLFLDINEIEGFDIEATGFNQNDIDILLGASEEEITFGDISDEEGENIPPASFKEYDEDIKTEHRCPKCGYEWSGSSK